MLARESQQSKTVAKTPTKDAIWIAGDSHGDFRPLIRAVQQYKPAAVIHVGDICGDSDQRPIDIELAPILDQTEFWWIPGNHDTDSEQAYDSLYRSTLASHCFEGRVVSIAGVKVAGLGGVFRSKVWMPPAEPVYDSPQDYIHHNRGDQWRGGLPLRHRSTIFESTYLTLADERADVLITHVPPSCHPHGFQAITELAQALHVRASFHGHEHDHLDYSQTWPRLGFHAYGVGLRGITALDGNVIVTGEKDDQRRNRQWQVHP